MKNEIRVFENEDFNVKVRINEKANMNLMQKQ